MMFERFTEKAIKVVMLAQEEARRLGHNFVGTEQILLGLIGESTGIAAKVRLAILIMFLTPDASCFCFCCFVNSSRWKHLRGVDVIVCSQILCRRKFLQVIKSMGINLKEARTETEKIIGRGSGFVAVEIPFTPRAKRVLELSLEEARQLGAMSSQTRGLYSFECLELPTSGSSAYPLALLFKALLVSFCIALP